MALPLLPMKLLMYKGVLVSGLIESVDPDDLALGVDGRVLRRLVKRAAFGTKTVVVIVIVSPAIAAAYNSHGSSLLCGAGVRGASYYVG